MTNINPALYYLRHAGFFNPEKQKATAVVVYGAGSVGSHLAYELAKLGTKSMMIVDFDDIEAHNISNQFYKPTQIGAKKSACLAYNLMDFTGIESAFDESKLSEDSDYKYYTARDSVHFTTFDNMDARKLVFENLRGFPVTLIDLRAGGEGWELFEVRMDDEADCEWFAKSLEGEFVELKCGEKTVIYNVTSLAAEACSHFKKWNLSQERPGYITRNMNSFKFMACRRKDRGDEDSKDQ